MLERLNRWIMELLSRSPPIIRVIIMQLLGFFGYSTLTETFIWCGRNWLRSIASAKSAGDQLRRTDDRLRGLRYPRPDNRPTTE